MMNAPHVAGDPAAEQHQWLCQSLKSLGLSLLGKDRGGERSFSNSSLSEKIKSQNSKINSDSGGRLQDAKIKIKNEKK
jgi:hypothetical protein